MDVTCPQCHMAQQVEIPKTGLDYFYTRCTFFDEHVFRVSLPTNAADVRWEFFKLGCAQFIAYLLIGILIIALTVFFTLLVVEQWM